MLREIEERFRMVVDAGVQSGGNATLARPTMMQLLTSISRSNSYSCFKVFDRTGARQRVAAEKRWFCES